MQLLKLLQEASSLQISDLKKAIKKDPRAAQILNKDLDLDSIRDKDAFLATLKYYFFNNSEVRNFIDNRTSVKGIYKKTFNELRMIRGKDLTAENLAEIKELIDIVFKEFASVERGSMSSELRKQLRDWFNTSGRYYNLPEWAMAELKSLPNVRPKKRIIVYRGVLFKSHDLKSKKTYDGSLEEGNGLKFLKSIRAGGREVDLEWDRPSSWTTSKSVALRFAQYGPASSQGAAMMQWFDRSMSKAAIDGALGYVISTFANPDDILIDTNLAGGGTTLHTGEAEVILQPGEYLSRVVHKFTVDGEVDPGMSEVKDEDLPIASVIRATTSFAKTFDINDLLDVTKNDFRRPVWASSSIAILANINLFKKLVLNSATTSVIHSYDKALEFYKKELDKVTKDELTADKYATKEELRKKVEQLDKLIANFRNNVVHSKFKSDKNLKAVGKQHELTGEEYRTTIKCYDVNTLEKELLVKGKIDSREGDMAIKDLANAVGVTLPGSSNMSKFGAPKQKPVFDEIVEAFFKNTGLDKPVDTNEGIKTILNLIRKAYRNYEMTELLENIQEILSEFK